MGTNRLEAFSDGVLAIVITIMVLELRPPEDSVAVAALRPLVGHFFSYILSFVYLAIYWNNHHHMLHVTQHVSGAVLWANMHLLFWLSLVPFVTAWMGQNEFAATPTALYGFVLLMAAVAYWILNRAILAVEGGNSLIARATRRDLKGTVSLLLYAIGIPAAYVSVWISGALYIIVALMWLVPDRRIERVLSESDGTDTPADPAARRP